MKADLDNYLYHIYSSQRSHLQGSSRRHADQNFRCTWRMLLPERRLHHQTRSARWYFLHHFEGSSASDHQTARLFRGEVHSDFRQRRLLWRKSFTGVSNAMNDSFHDLDKYWISFFSDDLRTANIICDTQEGVTCLVIDRETFNQLISNLDEVKNRYNDEGIIERRK